MRDHDLPALLRSAAADLGGGRSLADALAIAALAAERRLGVWKAALARPDELSGGIRALRDAAESALDPSVADDAPPSGVRADALRWLTDAMRARAVRLPSEILMPAEFYRSLAAADDTGCLAFSPAAGQLDAAAHLVRGCVVEMDAGEGKSLAAALAAAVLAASGRRVHVLTANDYLAARDCERHAPLLESLGLRVGLIIANMDADERRHQYAREIVFATAREIGFDYLRDGIARSFAERVSPAFDVAIADEADHLLVDQARVPLIISGEPSPETAVGEDAQSAALWMMDAQANVLDRLYAQIADKSANERRALATILLGGGLSARLESELERRGESARDALADILRMNDREDGRALERDLFFAIEPAAPPSLRLTERGWDEALRRIERADAAFEVVQTLRARAVHRADEDYVVDEEGVTLVDALDGRPLHSHRYMDGLHEALEAKEGAPPSGRTPPTAMTTVRALMSRYRAVCGLTGTATEAAPVFERDYGARTARVPPAAPSRRVDFPPVVFYDRAARDRALADEAEKWRLIGRPVLLSVANPRESAALSRALTERGIPHRALDAANAGDETGVVESAGRFGAVTVAAGMAGRGTDIIPAPDASARVIAACADLARAERGDTVFRCATRGEALALAAGLRERLGVVGMGGLDEAGSPPKPRGGAAHPHPNLLPSREKGSVARDSFLVSVDTPPLRKDDEVEVIVRRREKSARAASVRRVEFGLGLIVVIASVPASARVERQIRGRAARQGEFGAAKMILRVNDPAIAFSRHQRRLMDMKTPDADFASGAEVGRVLRRVQDEAEAAHRAAASVAAEFAAVIESESRAHRAAREEMMDGRMPFARLDALIAAWAARATDGLNDARTDYETRFDRVEDALRDGWGIDAAPLYGESPAAVRRALRDAAARRALALRDDAGARRFGRLLAESRLEIADAFFPARLAELQDAALSAMIGTLSLRDAAAHLAEQSRASRAAFWDAVDDALMRELLSADGGDSAPLETDSRAEVERLPPELSALL